MDVAFTKLLETISFFGAKTDRNKEETLTYLELLRYASGLARLNAEMVNSEIQRRFGGDVDDEQITGDPVTCT
jgi:hypothetical protein